MRILKDDHSFEWLRQIDRFQHKHQRYVVTDLGRAALRDYEGAAQDRGFLRVLQEGLESDDLY